MNEPYSKEEEQYVIDHYQEDGYVSVAAHLGRSTSSVRTKAFKLGVTAKYKKSKSTCEDMRKVKIDCFRNQGETTLQAVIERKREQDKNKVMLKINANSWIQVPRELATPEYAARIREKWAKIK